MGVTHVNGPIEIHVTSNNTYVIIYCIDAKLINNLEEQIFNQFNPDLNEIDDKCKPSKEDIKKFKEYLSNSFYFEDAGTKLVVSLRQKNLCLPNNGKQVFCDFRND